MARTRAKACGSKQRHKTKAAAWDHVFSLKRRQGARGLHVYSCKFCNCFHVGHLGKRR